MGVDLPTGITGKFTAHVLAQGLYSNEVLNVGNNAVVLPDVAAQFAGQSESYVQINHQNLNGNGSGDIVITADIGTDTTNYIDMGLNGSTYNYPDFTSAGPMDGYLMVQGDGANPGGNLVIGTFTENRDLIVSLGSTLDTGHTVRFKTDGTHLLTKPIFFADGTSQNTAAIAADLGTASFNKANTVNTYAYAANTWLQANDATTLATAVSIGQANVGSALAAAKVYTDQANTWLQANDVTTLTSAKSYSDARLSGAVANVELYVDASYAHANAANVLASAAFDAGNTTATNLVITNSVAQGGFSLATAANNKMQSAYNKANNALANTSGTFNGDLVVSGNLTSSNISLTGDASISYQLSASPATLLFSSKEFQFSGNTTAQGTIVVNATTYDYANTPLVSINGSTPSVPANPGYMLSVTGVDGVSSRVINTSFGTGTYALFAGRKGNGTSETPTAVANNDVIARFSGSGYNGDAFTPTGQGRIDIIADQDFTTANNGSRIEFYNTILNTNTVTKIATFNANTVSFTGSVNPMKGFVYNTRVPVGPQTSITIDYSVDSIIKANCEADLTISHTNFTTGKVIEVWLVNTAGQNHTITHGCTALNSTNKSTTATITAGSSMYLKFFSIDGDLANTFVSING